MSDREERLDILITRLNIVIMSDSVIKELSAKSTQERPIDLHPYVGTDEQGSWQALYDECVKPNPTNVLGMSDLSRIFGGPASDHAFDESMRLINALGPGGMRRYKAARQQAARASTVPGPELHSYVPYPTPLTRNSSTTAASQADNALLALFDWGSLLTTEALDGGSVSPPDSSVPEPAMSCGALSQSNVGTGLAELTVFQEWYAGDTSVDGGQESDVPQELLDEYEITVGTLVHLEFTGQADEPGDAQIDQDQVANGHDSRDETAISAAVDTTTNRTHCPHTAAADGL